MITRAAAAAPPAPCRAPGIAASLSPRPPRPLSPLPPSPLPQDYAKLTQLLLRLPPPPPRRTLLVFT